jgi:hypothetical protein
MHRQINVTVCSLIRSRERIPETIRTLGTKNWNKGAERKRHLKYILGQTTPNENIRSLQTCNSLTESISERALHTETTLCCVRNKNRLKHTMPGQLLALLSVVQHPDDSLSFTLFYSCKNKKNTHTHTHVLSLYNSYSDLKQS